MKDGTFPICPCYKFNKAFLIHPNSPVGGMNYWFVLEDMVNYFWGCRWESLIPSPTQRTGMKEANGTRSFSALWAKSPCPGTCPLLLASVIARCTCQAVPFHGAFCLHCSVPWPRAMTLAVLGKGFSEGLLQHGDVKLSLLQSGGSFIPYWKHDIGSPGVQGCAKWHPVSFEVFFIKTADKPRVVCESHLPKIQQVK